MLEQLWRIGDLELTKQLFDPKPSFQRWRILQSILEHGLGDLDVFLEIRRSPQTDLEIVATELIYPLLQFLAIRFCDRSQLSLEKRHAFLRRFRHLSNGFECQRSIFAREVFPKLVHAFVGEGRSFVGFGFSLFASLH